MATRRPLRRPLQHRTRARKLKIEFTTKEAFTASQIGNRMAIAGAIADVINPVTAYHYDNVTDFTVSVLARRTTVEISRIGDPADGGLIKELLDNESEMQEILDNSVGGELEAINRLAVSKIEVIVNPTVTDAITNKKRTHNGPIMAYTVAGGIVDAYKTIVSPAIHEVEEGMTCYAFTGEWSSVEGTGVSKVILDGNNCF